jgi:hypothetical protein
MTVKWVDTTDNEVKERYICTLAELMEIISSPHTAKDSILILMSNKTYNLQSGY